MNEPAGASQGDIAEGCAVDWSWLVGREILAACSDLQSLVITLSDGKTLTVRASLYAGAPFLSFTPWQEP